MSRNNDKLKSVRCVVYTRKSTDENLDLDFNSLDAQREAGEAYIKSQQHEGWVCLSERYDDAGFSGGTIERPAFQRLMNDVTEGKLDCIGLQDRPSEPQPDGLCQNHGDARDQPSGG